MWTTQQPQYINESTATDCKTTWNGPVGLMIPQSWPCLGHPRAHVLNQWVKWTRTPQHIGMLTHSGVTLAKDILWPWPCCSHWPSDTPEHGILGEPGDWTPQEPVIYKFCYLVGVATNSSKNTKINNKFILLWSNKELIRHCHRVLRFLTDCCNNLWRNCTSQPSKQANLINHKCILIHGGHYF